MKMIDYHIAFYEIQQKVQQSKTKEIVECGTVVAINNENLGIHQQSKGPKGTLVCAVNLRRIKWLLAKMCQIKVITNNLQQGIMHLEDVAVRRGRGKMLFFFLQLSNNFQSSNEETLKEYMNST
ncbi:uncharacterized protein isoform X1 [Bombus fervidus]|uniref:uncharacterized protein isoform X1 n=1 Tax=Bombus fervidus TaxID=203811 RepID=UPI003D188492